MPRRTWDVLVERRPHRIELEHGFFTARRRILLDGAEVPIPEEQQCPLPDFGSVHDFAIDGVPCAVLITSNGLSFSYDLALNGVSRATGGPPVLPRAPAHLPSTTRFVMEHPGLAALLFAAFGLVFTFFGVRSAVALASRPDVAPRVTLAASDQVPADDWVTVEGLEVDCSAPPTRLDETRYRFAGRDATNVPVFLRQHGDECARAEATGTLDVMGGTHGDSLRALSGAPKVRVLDLEGGPDNDRIGVIVCAVLVLLAGAMVALLAPRAMRTMRAIR